MPPRKTTRQLIKFSLYSTCLVLPKTMLEQLGWQQGDRVAIALDSTHQRLTVQRANSTDRPTSDTQQGIASTPVVVPPTTMGAGSISSIIETDSDVLPIPEIS